MLAALSCSLLLCGNAAAQAAEARLAPPILRYDSLVHPVSGADGMVVSQRRLASEIGAEILADGGNAVDAAVAVGFALAVTLPRAGNLGGGGFMIVHSADGVTSTAIDFREMAPAAAHRDVYLTRDGEVDRDSIRSSHRAAGVPGTVAGLIHALDNYGSLPLARVIEPAHELAAQGFALDYDTVSAIVTRQQRLRRQSYAESLFFRPDKTPYAPGESLRQPDLARSLREIADRGADAFYRGRIARLIVAEMERAGGWITLEDLDNYKAVEREPVRGSYKGFEIVSMPPPSSGGVHLVQILNVLERFPLDDYGHNSAATLHVMAEAMKYAYADRSEHLGDPDFYPVPIAWLTSKAYAAQIAGRIRPGRATASTDIAPGRAPPVESTDTTHFSVFDSSGMAVATTYTLNFSFGSGIAVPGAGFLLNNEMADFSAKPGVPNAFGLLGNEANAVAAGKRPLSAMTPTVVLRDGKPYMVTGSPGGSRIITAVLQNVVNVIEFEMNVALANHAPRIHHQWFPDVLRYERGVSPDSLSLLESFGHRLEVTGTMGSVQGIVYDGETFHGSADPRRPGAGAVAVR